VLENARRVWLTAVVFLLVLAGLVGVLISSAEIDPDARPPTAELTATSQPTATLDPAFRIGEGTVSLRLEPVVNGLTAPVSIVFASDEVFYIADQTGVITAHTTGGDDLGEVLDVSNRLVTLNPSYDERGLLGMALHPDFESNGRMFIHYSGRLQESGREDWDNTGYIVEYTVEDNAANPDSRREVILVDQRWDSHNGGQLAFGPDGYLYIGIGDGGAGGDPRDQGQDPTTPLGSILRIDVDNGDPYSVPADNPLPGLEEAVPEVYAYGFRNPYRFSFDRLTGDLYVGDIGQTQFEEVDLVEAGGNYGWVKKEGFHCFNMANFDNPQEECAESGRYGEPLLDPILEYSHQEGTAVIAGYVYRGSLIDNLYGRYLFADWGVQGRGTIFIGTPQDDGTWLLERAVVNGDTAGKVPQQVYAIGEDPSGEFWLLSKEGVGPEGETGKVWRILPG